MANFLRTSFVIVLTSLTISVKCAAANGPNEALHFARGHTWYTFDEVIFRKLNFPKIPNLSATACPAKTEEEDAFNTNNSFSKHSLFVRNVYEADQTSRDVAYNICDQPYQMSVVYDTTTANFKFGFEIYFEKSKFATKGFVDSNRGQYDSIKNTAIGINYLKFFYNRLPTVPGLSRIASLPKAAVSKLLRKSLYLDAEGTKELGFVWIDSLILKFDYKAVRMAQAIYTLSVTTRGRKQCDNYNLGKEYFNDLDMNELYLENNQEKMLENVVLPESKIDGEPNEMACESENKCFEKWSSVPPEILGHLAIHPVSCSNLLTVPIWKSTVQEVLNTLDNFLYALSIVVGHPIGDLTVSSNVHGVLNLPQKNYYLWSKKPIKMVVNGIPVPNRISKLIEFRSKVCTPEVDFQNKSGEMKTPENKPTVDNPISERTDPDKNELKDLSGNDDKNDALKNQGSRPAYNTKTGQMIQGKCKHAKAAIIVVIENDPYFKPETDRICHDVCETAGWEIIKLRKFFGKEITSKYIYCCGALDQDAQKKLNIKYDIGSEYGLESANVNFSLEDVPIYDFKTNNFEKHNIKDLVIKTYKHLFEGDKYDPIKQKEWETLMSFHHINMQFLQIEAPIDDVKIEEHEEDGEKEHKNDKRESDSSESQSEDEEKMEKQTSKDVELGEER